MQRASSLDRILLIKLVSNVNIYFTYHDKNFSNAGSMSSAERTKNKWIRSKWSEGERDRISKKIDLI